MAAEELPTSEEEVPFFEDVLVDTKTKRAEWILGRNNLLAELGCGPGQFDNAIKHRLIPFRIVKRGDGMQGRPMFAFWRGHLEQIRPVLAPPPPPVVERPTQKLQAVRLEPVPAPTFINTGTPFMAPEDADAIKQSLWAVKGANDVNSRALNQLASAVDANTKATRDLIDRMVRIFEGDKKE